MDLKDQRFGIEIEMTGITRQRAAEVCAEYFGTQSSYAGSYYSTYAALDSQGRQWQFMSDGSIEAPELAQAYANDVISKKTGEFSKQRYFSQGRFARRLTSYHYTGFFDLSVTKRGRKEPDNKYLNKLYHEYISYLRERYSNKNTVLFYDYEVFCLFQYLASIQIYELEEVSATTIVAYLKTTKQSRQRAVLCGLRLYFPSSVVRIFLRLSMVCTPTDLNE